MSALLTSIPGDIPGLLRRGSPVLIDFWRADCLDLEATGDPDLDGLPSDYLCRGAILSTDEGIFTVAWLSSVGKDGGTDEIHPGWLALDLTDPTGRAHAAWWLTGRLDQHPGDVTWQAICRATTGIDMTPAQIDTLARLVLRLAGRTP